MIKFFDPVEQDKPYQYEIQKSIERVIKSGVYSNGDETKQFEQEYARFNGVKYCAFMSDGTAAIEVMLKASGIDKNSVVVVPASSFLATASAVYAIGANVVFVDTDESGLMDLNLLEKELKSRKITDILVVNLYGNVLDYTRLTGLSEKYGAKLFIDGAQNHGCNFNQKPLNDFCVAQSQSFYTTKTIGCYGEAGCILTNDEELYQKYLSMRNHGRNKDNTGHIYLTGNHRGDEIQAAILRVKIKHRDYYIGDRVQSFNRYKKNLQDSDYLLKWNGLEIFDNNFLGLGKLMTGNTVVPYVFPILSKKRDELKVYLKKSGIDTAVHYARPINYEACIYNPDLDYCPNADRHSKEVLSLPFYAGIGEDKIDQVCERLLTF